MTAFSGKFDYLGEAGNSVQDGACRLTVDDASLRIVPEKGQPIALDLGDIDIFSPGEYELPLKLYTGRTIVLHHFAKTFEDMRAALKDAYRGRLLQCLLLEDLEEIDRFEGFVQLNSSAGAFACSSQLRLYKSNLAVLPDQATGLSWRLSDIDDMEFDESAYRLELHSGEETLVISKLAKRTTEFVERLRAAVTDVTDRSAGIIQDAFPFLSPDQFQTMAALMKEGHAAPLADLSAVHPQAGPAVFQTALDDTLKPYTDMLRKKLAQGCDVFAGFKMVRPEAQTGVAAGETGEPQDSSAPETPDAGLDEEADASSGQQGEQKEEALYWFFLPMLTKINAGVPANVIAWEAASHSGRATYFFRINIEDVKGTEDAVAAKVRRLNRALVMINFRREPIYLSDDSLMSQARYRHYTIACRKLPVLRELRASYIGRAIHTSPEAWEKQVDAILASA